MLVANFALADLIGEEFRWPHRLEPSAAEAVGVGARRRGYEDSRMATQAAAMRNGPVANVPRPAPWVAM